MNESEPPRKIPRIPRFAQLSSSRLNSHLETKENLASVTFEAMGGGILRTGDTADKETRIIMEVMGTQMFGILHSVFAMVKTKSMVHDHQAPFWFVVFLVVVGNEAVTQGENKLPYAQYTSDPDSEPSN